METPTSSFRDGTVEGKGYRGTDPSKLWAGEFDLVIGSSSWDHRSVELCKSKMLDARCGVLILYDDKDPFGWREAHDPQLIEHFRKSWGGPRIVSGRSTDIRQLWGSLRATILRQVEQEGRALSVFFDISACPRFLFLAALRLGIGDGLFRKISFGYAEAKYADGSKDNVADDISFRDGEWQPIAVTGYEGQYEPANKRFYLISLGFDGGKTFRVVARKEPDRVAVLLADPGSSPNYGNRALTANRALIDQFRLDDRHIVRAAAGDCVQAWSVLTEAKLEHPISENTFFLCTGTKPHALALGLRALCGDYAAVLYNVPAKHIPQEVKPNGAYWRYDIISTSAMR